MPRYDAIETHRREIAAPKAVAYAALWNADLGASPVIRFLSALRSLPAMLLSERRVRPRRLDLNAMVGAGFGKLAEDAPDEVVLGVTGRFWRPVGNLLPFREADFRGPVMPGTARAVWNFALQELSPGRTVLTTETRVLCGDPASRRKFLAYWLLIRPFSGWIRVVMLEAIDREAMRHASRSDGPVARP
ncbi:MAG TPA: hypothetical protein VN634_21810 [Candidatus Limnocylindrales bacterium]|nr:hypothetical protein [Candidatus Limnocylindrales bacterium]